MTVVRTSNNLSKPLLLAVIGALLLLIGVMLGQRLMPQPQSGGLEVADWSLPGAGDKESFHGPAEPAGRHDKMPFVRARLMQDAIRQRDFAGATRIAGETLAESRAKIWTLYPFADFIGNVSDLGNASFEGALSKWVDQAPLSALPRLVRAQYYYELAWSRRGHRFSTETDEQAQAAFSSALSKSVEDIRRVLELEPTSAYGLYMQVKIIASYGATTELADALNQAISVYPDYMPAYDTALSATQPKWSGSIDMMYDLVERYGANAEDGSPRQPLPLLLYKYLLMSAGTTCYRERGDAYTTCFQDFMRQTVRPGLDDSAAKALRAFGRANAFETNAAVSDVLSAMISQSGADAYAGRLLQVAADSYGVDPRLTQTPAADNFIIDKLVASSWLFKGFYDNAFTKYKEALEHLPSARFPTPEQRDMAVADIYETLTMMYSKSERPADMIDAATAALALDGKASSRIYLCFGNYQLKRYDQAVEECSKITADPTSGIEAHYWRAQVYKAMNDGDKAADDFMVVANSQDNRRAGAVIELSMIYFGRKDNKAALDILNRYPFLYDAAITSKDDVAVGYNNRCYAYMELGDLTKALDDCNASLRYGSIPDAFKKKEELVARLSQ
jgi:tetratricopeptide (TPR) repeat protein